MDGKLGLFGASWQFFFPTKIVIRPGAAQDVGKEANSLGARRALIVTDPGIVKAGLVTGVRESLRKANVAVDVFDKVELEPPARVIDAAAEYARNRESDLIVGLGGGSSLDTAKGVSIMATNPGKVLDYAGFELVPKRGLPKIMLPTTGSGSEVTRVFAPTDEGDQSKKVVYTNFNLAEIVLVDPLLSISMPPDLTADTGIDALIAAIEPYVSVNANPFSDLMALQAMRLIGENLPVVYAKGDNVPARTQLSLAATMANLAWQSAGLGAVHALTYVLETECHLRHARACSIMLPHVMDYNKIGNLRKYGQIAQALGEKIDGLSDFGAAERSVTAVKRLLESVDISCNLSDYGVSETQIPKLVEGAMRQARLFVPNPRNLSEGDVRNIYQKALG